MEISAWRSLVGYGILVLNSILTTPDYYPSCSKKRDAFRSTFNSAIRSGVRSTLGQPEIEEEDCRELTRIRVFHEELARET